MLKDDEFSLVIFAHGGCRVPSPGLIHCVQDRVIRMYRMRGIDYGSHRGLALIIPRLRSIMAKENPESELTRLRKEQNKTQQDEVFGGLSPAERAECNGKAKRINELEIARTGKRGR
jgi:hypothetical protein